MATNNYSITFKSLRAGTVYVVNIGGGTGAAIPLKGGAEPFFTQEDSSDDLFTPVRTQTGYLRVVDDGMDANGNAWDWHDLIPETETSRPVTLTAGGSILWRGFMQAQDFGSLIYGNPQEREFPIQCPLSVTECSDVNYEQKHIKNFAYLLQQILLSIPEDCRPTTIMAQGGVAARFCLLRQIDWQNFATEDGNGNMVARFTMFECLEDMCRFWRWTARTSGTTLWLIGSTHQQEFLSLSLEGLALLADGTSTGAIVAPPAVKTLSGDIFASTYQQEMVMRGIYKATVRADGNAATPSLVALYPQSVIKDMKAGTDYTESWDFVKETVTYTGDITEFTTDLLKGSAPGGSFNQMTVKDDKEGTAEPVVRIRQNYDGSTLVSFETVYEHSLCDGFLEIRGEIYKYGGRFDYSSAKVSEQQHMWLRVGVGVDRSHAVWATPGIGGRATWSSAQTAFQVIIGNGSDLLARLQLPAAAYGLVFIDLLGSQDFNPFPSPIPIGWTDHTFEIADFSVSMQRSTMYLDLTTGILGGKWKERELADQRTYEAMNTNKNRNEWTADCIFACDNDMTFGYGVLLNEDGTPLKGVGFVISGYTTYEQILADAVANYWRTAKRKMEMELRYEAVGNVLPQDIVQVAGVTGYAISISHEWRDDIINVTTLEI